LATSIAICSLVCQLKAFIPDAKGVPMRKRNSESRYIFLRKDDFNILREE
jgi:hypothetical protein